MKSLLRQLLGWTLLALASGYFLHFLVRNASALAEFELTAGKLAIFLLLACLWATSNIVTAGTAWHLLLSSAEIDTRRSTTIRVFALSQPAKYLPGNVAHHIGRVLLMRREGHDPKKVAWTVGLETYWVAVSAVAQASTGALMVGPGLFWGRAALGARELTLGLALLVAIPALGYWLVSSPPLRRLPILRGLDGLEIPPARVLCICLLLYTINVVVMAGVLNLLAAKLFAVPDAHFWLFFAAWPLAWVAGFLTPGAPAGLGIREGLLIAMLAPALGSGASLGVVVAQRALTALAEGLGFLTAVTTRRGPLEPVDSADGNAIPR